MSLKELNDEELLAFRQDPIAFLRVKENFETVFQQDDQEVRRKVAAVSYGLGRPKNDFDYNIEETK